MILDYAPKMFQINRLALNADYYQLTLTPEYSVLRQIISFALGYLVSKSFLSGKMDITTVITD